MIVDAAGASKHIYCEKPMTQTVPQSKKAAEKAKQSGVKMQVGVQGMSDDSYETALKYVQQGALGKVLLAQIDYSRNYKSDFWRNPPHDYPKPGMNLHSDASLSP